MAQFSRAAWYRRSQRDPQAALRLTYPSGRVVGYSFDNESRLMAVQQNGAAFAGSFTYDDSGRLASYATGPVTHTVMPGGIVSVEGDTAYSRDPCDGNRARMRVLDTNPSSCCLGSGMARRCQRNRSSPP